MKKILFNSIIAISFFSSITKLNAQCTFDIVGTTSVSTTSALSDMAVAPNKKVYTIAYNTTSGNMQLKSAFTASSSWTLNATIACTTSVKPVIKIRNDGKIYVFLSDGNAVDVGKVYSSTGGPFTQLGPDVSTNAVSDLSIAFNSIGEEFVAYTDIANSNRSTIKKWNGSAWVNVGTTGLASTSGAFYNSLILDNTNNPVIAFGEMASGYKISVMKLSGSNWVPVVGTGTVSAAAATNSVLKTSSNGNYYLGYNEGDNIIVQTYNGSVWSPLGNPVTAMLSTANTFDFDLDPTDVPYFTCIQNTSNYPTAYKYVGVPTWTTVATGYINTSTNNTNPNIDVDNAGTPYFSYVDVFANNGLSVKTLASPITISSQPLATLQICDGSAGSFSITVAGGTPTYQWQSATTGAFTNAGAPYVNASTNILSFTANPGINQNKIRSVVNVGCKNLISNTSTLTVLINPTVNLTTTNPSCFGTCNGMITANPIGGTAPYTFSWSPVFGASATLPSLCAGTYSVLVKDANNCSVSANANLFSPSGISSSVSGNLSICSGNSTTLTLTAAGGTPGYTYSWSPGASLNSTNTAVVIATPAATQIYTATVTDANGCVKSTTVNVTVNALPPVSAGPDNTICTGNSTTNSATGAHTYTWNPGGFIGANQNVTPFSTTTYTVIGTNTLTGCTNSDTKMVFVNPNPTINAVSNPTTLCSGATATLTASGAVSYTWNPGSLTGTTITVSPASNIVYTVTGMAATGCSNTKTLSLTVSPNPTVTVVSNPTAICAGSSATLTASGAVSYTWVPGSIVGGNIVVTPTTSTIYTVTGTNGGCTNTKTLSLIVNANPVATASNSGPLTCSTITVALNSGSVAGATYLWTGPSFTSTLQNPTANMSGSYNVLVTNSGTGCSGSAVTSVTQNTTPPSPTANTTGTLTCTTTTVTLNGGPGAGVTYQWSGPSFTANTQNAVVSSPGTYILNVTSAVNGCTNSASTNVTQNTVAPLVTATVNNTLTCITSTANAIATTTTSSVFYNWSGTGIIAGAGTSTITVNTAGIKNCTVTNTINGCATTVTVSVSQNTTTPTTTASTSGSVTCTTSTVNLNSSLAGMNYTWTAPGGSAVFSGINSQNAIGGGGGTYSLTVVNPSSGCSYSITTSVSQNTTMPTGVTAGSNQTLTCISPSVSLNGSILTPTNAVINWTGGVCGSVTTLTTSACSVGVYTLTATNPLNGCSSSSTVQVSPNTGAPVVTNNPITNSITCTNTLVTVSIYTTVSPVSYAWSGTGIVSGNGTGTITVSQSGTKSYTVTNTSNGCISIGSQVVSQNTTSPTASATTTGTLTCTTSTVTLNGGPSTGVTYLWTGGATTQNTSASSPGVYTLLVTNTVNGCTNTATIIVSQNTTVPTINAGSNQTITCSSPTVAFNAISSADPLTTYSWITPATGSVSNNTINNPTASGSGIFTVSVTDSGNGCMATSTVEVFVDAAIPTITVMASPSTICSGNSTTLTAGGSTTTVDYVWNPGNLNGATQNVSPASSTSYTVVATNTISGCSSTTTIAVTVNPNPTLAIAGNTNICKGTTTDLTTSGAVSYLWDSGATTNSISVTPIVTTTYTVTGTNIMGCSSTITTMVSIISSKSITGVITNTNGATGGDIILYKYSSALSQWDSVTVTPLTSSYSFSNIDSALYVVRAIPTATNIQVTYGTSSISWQNATIITHGCTSNTYQNITLIPLAPIIPGPGVLTGTITEASGFGQRTSSEFKPLAPGQPIGGVIVKGGRNPGGQMFVQTTTNAAGQYTLTGLPLNVGDSYFVLVDIPGLDTNGTYHVIITAGNTQIDGLNFTVDSIYINPIESVTGISQESSVLDNKIMMFPNPAKQYVSIQYELIQSAKVQIELYDVIGNKVKTITELNSQNKNKYNHVVNLENLSSGIYFVKLKINNSENVIKLIVND